MEDGQIYIDMDGTVVSYHDRFYKIYKYGCLKIGIVPYPKDIWLSRRRDGYTEYAPGVHEKLTPIFEKLFEDRKYLKIDKIIPHMDEVIHELQKEHEVIIVSFRVSKENLAEQLRNLGINNVKIINQGFYADTPNDEKARMIQKVVSNPHGYIIGDTFREIIAGKKLGLTTIGVPWGDQSKETLMRYNPDHVVIKPEEILEIIK